jgi:hypothetical protein
MNWRFTSKGISMHWTIRQFNQVLGHKSIEYRSTKVELAYHLANSSLAA